MCFVCTPPLYTRVVWTNCDCNPLNKCASHDVRVSCLVAWLNESVHIGSQWPLFELQINGSYNIHLPFFFINFFLFCLVSFLFCLFCSNSFVSTHNYYSKQSEAVSKRRENRLTFLTLALAAELNSNVNKTRNIETHDLGSASQTIIMNRHFCPVKALLLTN